MKYEKLSSINYLINNTFPVIRTLELKDNDFKIEVVKIKDLGKALVINGDLQLIDSQAHKYHEPMVHTPASYIDNPKNALILGGGDGGLCHELLKYDTIKNITVVEISRDVVELCQKHFASFSNSLNNEKVKLIFSNAKSWIEDNTDKFDLIFIDTTELGELHIPNSPKTTLKDNQTLSACKKALSPQGILTQNDFYCGLEKFTVFSNLINTKKVFNYCTPFVSNIPYFPSQAYSFLMMSNAIDFSNHIIKRKDIDTIFYNEETHMASLAMCEESKSFKRSTDKTQKMICSTTLIDLEGVKSSLIDNTKEVLDVMKNACKISGLNIIKSESHKFDPQGVTVSILLKESHFTCHSWPEHNKIYFDLNTCGDVEKARLAVDHLIKTFEPKNKSIQNIPRY
ncbi:MAG: adenosylmethionine decarboxylase [Rhodospirillaceae bacterium]|nr:adenosylmethionine decarboxylase [Rhodospirillaceae bacterium]